MDKNSKVIDIYRNPVGHDILSKILLQMGKSEKLVTNPIVRNMKIKTVEKLTRKKVGDHFFTILLDLLNSEKALPTDGKGSIQPTWWKEAVFYQIYPRSFRDNNGDGIGDLRGIIEKLDYLKNLGVTALWLSPIYDSPNDDNGYDIRDYDKIMQEFGTMEDFEELLKGVHDRGMRLIMDLVVNHTSDEHKWFEEALHNPNSKYRNYYFFRDGEKEIPNNWTSFFSGPAWNHYEKEDTWALHLFSKKQMDLNWDNPEVRADVIAMINRWLDRGVDGFRMDVINYISKKDNLPQGDDLIGQLMGFYGIENYFYGPHLHEYLHEIREKAFEPHGAFSVGETPGLGMEMAKLVTGEERKELDMVFSFDHLETPGHVRFDDYRYDLNYWRDYMIDWMEHYGNNCRMSLFYNNHDNPRMISKVNPDPQYRRPLAKLLAVMQMTLCGTPFIFQGDEMGLVNYDFTDMNQITDVEAKGLYQELIKEMSPQDALHKIIVGTREHARILLPWEDRKESNADRKHAGLWQDPDSDILEFYRKLLEFRKDNEAIFYGDFEVVRSSEDLFTYIRRGKEASYLIDCNLGISPRKRYCDVHQQLHPVMGSVEDTCLQAYGFTILELG